MKNIKEVNCMDISSAKILVVMGGTSSERDISLMSGNAVLEALKGRGLNAGGFVLDGGNAAQILQKNPDCVFIALHGKGGEDGTIQGMLEIAGIPYTGSGVAGSAVCMNKVLSKKILAESGVRTARYISVSPGDDFCAEELARNAIDRFGLPLVIKASCQGSSVGVEIVREETEVSGAIKRVYEYDKELLIEEFLPGKELTVPLLQKPDGLFAFPIIEIVSENEFYDFKSKYQPGMSHHIIPARIPEETAAEAVELAKKAYICLNCGGLTRVDLMLGPDGEPYVVELNTIPGMTATSLVPDSAAAIGIGFGELTEMIIRAAIEK